MKLCKFLFSIVFSTMAAAPLRADLAVGLWQSQPDATGLVVHVRTKNCGSAICGRIERAKDLRGYDTPSSVVGRRMIMGMLAQEDGSYAGQIWEPQRNKLLTARMQVQGNVMRLRNCDESACQDIVWQRLR
ncbi:hypothetical protein Z945_1460 [Sulfitobacter noctilucae]|uniref:DUF2147 domain-containing protein n=1 Tax=Sulfitobacter noctilucae TaxID=1342302 RepID=UPI0005681F4A|nr:DUF2147 domain-containing protein [Sulfitobacter noctilucae]KIN60487.1 hypothetical protein Z945_1460 [Sulfitobacter noctilucae]